MRNIEQGTFIQYMMSRKYISTSGIARSMQVSPAAVSQVIWGSTRSKRLHKTIAHELGFPDWTNLKQAEKAFNASANKTLKQVSQHIKL